MKSLEMKSEPMLNMPMSSMYPSFGVCDDQMSEVQEWKVDNEYTLTVKVRMTYKTENVTPDGIDTDARFDILSYEVAS